MFQQCGRSGNSLAEPRQPFKSMQRKLANVEIVVRPTQANEQEETRAPQLLRASALVDGEEENNLVSQHL